MRLYLIFLTFGVQEFGETQVVLGDVEGLLQVVRRIGARQLVELYQVRSAGRKHTHSHGKKLF